MDLQVAVYALAQKPIITYLLCIAVSVSESEGVLPSTADCLTTLGCM